MAVKKTGISNTDVVRQVARSIFSIAVHNNRVPPTPQFPVHQKIFPNQTTKMSPSSRDHVTMRQDGNFGDQEFVVACKGRPFTILSSTNLPTPLASYIDHKLVAELKLRISDLQCSKLFFGSKKMRILGKISTTVQCIRNGQISGNLYIKASVVENLCENFDVHCIAGNKLSQLLTSSPDQDHDANAQSDDEPTTPQQKKKRKKTSRSSDVSPSSSTPNLEKTQTSTPSSTPARDQDISSPFSASFTARRTAINATLAAQAKQSPDHSIFERIGYPPTSPPTFATEGSPSLQSPRRSPPGFPAAKYSPSTNISRLCAMGGVMIGQLRSGQGHPVFYPDHGPRKCLPSCRGLDPPLNCGYNVDYSLPTGFQMCGHACRGAFCDCLRSYSEYGYYG